MRKSKFIFIAFEWNLWKNFEIVQAIEKLLSGVDKCPNMLKTLFENPNSEYDFLRMRNQQRFIKAVLKIEGLSHGHVKFG